MVWLINHKDTFNFQEEKEILNFVAYFWPGGICGFLNGDGEDFCPAESKDLIFIKSFYWRVFFFNI